MQRRESRIRKEWSEEELRSIFWRHLADSRIGARVCAAHFRKYTHATLLYSVACGTHWLRSRASRCTVRHLRHNEPRRCRSPSQAALQPTPPAGSPKKDFSFHTETSTHTPSCSVSAWRPRD